MSVPQSRPRTELSDIEKAQALARGRDREVLGTGHSVHDMPGVAFVMFSKSGFEVDFKDGRALKWTWPQLDAGKPGKVIRESAPWPEFGSAVEP